MTVAPDPGLNYTTTVDTLVIGAGACGMVAALSAKEHGDSVVVLEKDPAPAGSTALSSGLIPAAGTDQQRAAGIEDSVGAFAADILRKAEGEADPDLVHALAEGSAEAIAWMTGDLGIPLTLVDDFDYPGHGIRRTHGPPGRSGRELIKGLLSACQARQVAIRCGRRVTTLFATSSRQVTGVEAQRPDGRVERIGCRRLILASSGFAGNATLVQRHIPDMGDATYLGHDGSVGDALQWGVALGAGTRFLGAHQGHGNVADPFGIPISWAVITEGGIQVNAHGERFWNENQGYSEAAQKVLNQPGRFAWSVFDERIAGIVRQFADYRLAEDRGAVVSADTIEDLAGRIGVPGDALSEAFAEMSMRAQDPFGREFDPAKTLSPPYRAVRVTGALFHTQGGLDVTPDARVKRRDGSVLPNLFAAGGAACGVSGSADLGYLSGNGLLCAVVLGRIAGQARLPVSV